MMTLMMTLMMVGQRLLEGWQQHHESYGES
jgi:hypothetical protein